MDLGLALMDASPEECEDELRRLHIALESMVGCLLPRLHHAARSGVRFRAGVMGLACQARRCDSICIEVW